MVILYHFSLYNVPFQGCSIIAWQPDLGAFEGNLHTGKLDDSAHHWALRGSRRTLLNHPTLPHHTCTTPLSQAYAHPSYVRTYVRTYVCVCVCVRFVDGRQSYSLDVGRTVILDGSSLLNTLLRFVKKPSSSSRRPRARRDEWAARKRLFQRSRTQDFTYEMANLTHEKMCTWAWEGGKEGDTNPPSSTTTPFSSERLLLQCQ